MILGDTSSAMIRSGCWASSLPIALQVIASGKSCCWGILPVYHFSTLTHQHSVYYWASCSTLWFCALSRSMTYVSLRHPWLYCSHDATWICSLSHGRTSSFHLQHCFAIFNVHFSVSGLLPLFFLTSVSSKKKNKKSLLVAKIYDLSKSYHVLSFNNYEQLTLKRNISAEFFLSKK